MVGKIFKKAWRIIKAIIRFILKFIRVLLNILTVMFIGAIIVSIVAYIYIAPKFDKARREAYDKLVSVNSSTFSMKADTEIYDKDNNLIGTVNAGHYEYTPVSDISMTLQNGYIAVEDKRFKEHFGIDFKGTFRAVYKYLKHKGVATQGGSSITQQVIKNNLLTQKRTLDRKLVEFLLAPYIDTRFGKDKIMEYYCNTNYYGHRSYGVYSASKYYFDKLPKDLDYDESALLIALSNNPSKYDPVSHPESAKERRNFNLDEMFNYGLITEEQLNAYKNKDLHIVQNYVESTKENYQTSYAIHCSAIELMKADGFDFKYTFKDKDDFDSYKEKYSDAYAEKSDSIRDGGYKIYTTLDSEKQAKLQEILDNSLSGFTEIDQETSKLALQGDIVAIDNNTNSVVAIIGGRGTDDEYNRGYLGYRQPGSVIKPLLDYAPAFDTGEYFPSKVINDHEFEGGPSNAGGHYRGDISIREALNRSINTVAWQVLSSIGIENGLEYLGKMDFLGISYIDNNVPAISLGGFTKGLRPVDIAKGYSTLANLGVYSDKTCINSIVKDGDTITLKKENKVQVYQPDTAFMITDILRGTLNEEYGTGHGLGVEGYDLAGKTGTTNDGKDTWFSGYSKDYTVTVWVGYDTPREMPNVYGATYSGKIWQSCMQYLLTGVENKPFINYKPDTVYIAKYDGSGNEIPNTAENKERVGGTDYFSSLAKSNFERIAKERADKQKYEEANKMLTDFENFYFNSVEDTQAFQNKYITVLNKVSLVENDDDRNKLLSRLSAKKSELDVELLNWADQIKEYQDNLAVQQENERKAKVAEEEKKRKDIDTQNRINTFDLAVSSIKEKKYKDSNERDNLFNDLKNKLDRLSDLDVYKSKSNEYLEAMKYYDSLPDKSTYESSVAESESIDAYNKEKIKSDVDKSIEDYNESSSYNSSYQYSN
jgi:hypothetical protein